MMKTTKGTTDGGNSAGDNIIDNFNIVKFREAATSQLVECFIYTLDYLVMRV
jgi:hypothetical protein